MHTESINKSRVALDTSILLDAIELKIDIYDGVKAMLGRVEFIVPKQVLKEIEKISGRSVKMGKGVKIAKALMKKNRVKAVNCDGKTADDALENLAQKAIIATNDRGLIKRIKKVNGQIIYLRKRKYLAME